MREVYARYFFSLFDASLHADEVGRRQAQQHLEDYLTRQSACAWAGVGPAPEAV
jgi:hypothetical protein